MRDNHFRKKAQIAGQIFIYIMAIAVIGAIALIGTKAIKGVMEKTCSAEKVSFQSDIEALIEKYNSNGSVERKTLRAPCDYESLCFVAAKDVGSAYFECENKIIEDSVKRGVHENIYVISSKNTLKVGYSDLVSLNMVEPNSCLCIPQRNGNFNLKFTGTGPTTAISENINNR